MSENKITPVNPEDAFLLKAMESDFDLERLEKLIQLKERTDKAAQKKAFLQAFGRWQAEKPELVKKKKASFKTTKGFNKNYQFNNLASIQKQIDPFLTKHGLSYRWESKQENGKIYVKCILSHEDGHVEEGEFLFAAPDSSGNKNDIQSVGSAKSYLRRLTLEDMVGVSSDDDDDGAKAGPFLQKPKKDEKQAQPKPEAATPDQIAKMEEILNHPLLEDVKKEFKSDYKSYSKTKAEKFIQKGLDEIKTRKEVIEETNNPSK